MAGACVAPASTVVPAQTQRLLVPASSVAVYCSIDDPPRAGCGGPDDQPPPAVPFGRRSAGEVVLLVRFPLAWGEAPVERAFLLLRPAQDAVPDTKPVALDIATAVGRWGASAGRLSSRPALSRPVRRIWSTTLPARPLRIDVTDLIARASRARAVEAALAVVALPQDALGCAFATGPDGGGGPELDVYLR